MNLKLAICKKEGTTNYGSNGSQCGSLDRSRSGLLDRAHRPCVRPLAPGPDRRGGQSACPHADGAAGTAAAAGTRLRLRSPPAAGPDRQPAPRPERPIDPNRLRNDGSPGGELARRLPAGSCSAGPASTGETRRSSTWASAWNLPAVAWTGPLTMSRTFTPP